MSNVTNLYKNLIGNLKYNFKNYTRKEFIEFLEETDYSNTPSSDINNPLSGEECPYEFKLKEDCTVSCKLCWLKAIKNIKFKGE